MVKRLLTALALWYDESADWQQHERVVETAEHAERAQSRADRAVAAYRREQLVLRRK